jgi:uncharacterized membrane protein
MDQLYFMDAVITPHRSLSRRGLVLLIAVLTALNAASAGFFLWIGAGPVPIFLGLDVMAVIIAFRVSNRSASRQERVQVTEAEVRVVLQSRRETRLLWASPTAFTRVALLGEPGDEDDLHIHLSDQRLRLAAALSRPERLAFARALETAIRRARSSRIG